jgi:hypothetical protein
MKFFVRPFTRIMALPLMILAGFTMLMSASVRTYTRLTDETVIAELSFRQVADQVFEATLLTDDACREEQVTLYGDQWRVDASFLKWKYWASVLGLDAQYRLDRIEGRYIAIEDENSKHHAAYSLAPQTMMDVGSFSDMMGNMNFLADAEYGVSTYTDMTPGKSWLVYKTQTGIITRPRTGSERLPGEPLKIEINAGCVDHDSLVAGAADWLDRTLVDLFRQQ